MKDARENILTHEIPTGKIFGPTKARWHGGTRPTEFSTLHKKFA